MKIICDDKIPFIRGVLEPYAEVEYLSGQETTHPRLRGVDALITRTRTICDKNLLQGTPVCVIASATIGFDHIDTRWCEEHGIVWRNAPGCNSGSVAQYIASVLLSLERMHELELLQMTLGIVGVGHVGTKVAEFARALGMRVLLNDPRRAERGESGFVSLDELICCSDIVTLHVPLVRGGEYCTYHLFDEKRISALSGKFLINTSRGPVVDNLALRKNLEDRSSRLKGAVLDVWEGEPNIDRRLLDLLDIATPHIAGYSADGKANGTGAAVRTVSEVLDLPLRGWSPSGLPAPASLSLDLEIDPAGKSSGEILSEAVLHTYDVRSDSYTLRSAAGLQNRVNALRPVVGSLKYGNLLRSAADLPDRSNRRTSAGAGFGSRHSFGKLKYSSLSCSPALCQDLPPLSPLLRVALRTSRFLRSVAPAHRLSPRRPTASNLSGAGSALSLPPLSPLLRAALHTSRFLSPVAPAHRLSPRRSTADTLFGAGSDPSRLYSGSYKRSCSQNAHHRISTANSGQITTQPLTIRRPVSDSEFAAAFERLRGDYPIRREPSAFTIRFTSSVNPSLIASLRALGFKVTKK